MSDDPSKVAELAAVLNLTAVAIIDGQHGGMFTCGEAEQFYEALFRLGEHELAENFMHDHAEHDEEYDMHCTGPEYPQWARRGENTDGLPTH